VSRTRLIRPAFFKHGELYDAERETGLPIRVAFAGLWTVADRAGRFAWKPRDIKPDVLPHDPVNFADVLDALHAHGFVTRYRVGGKDYGAIPGWEKQQPVHKTEQPSTLPGPLDNGAITVPPRVNAVAVTVAVTDTGANYSAPLAPERDECLEAIRTHLYVPDGKCPTGWDEQREGSILKQLRTRYKAGDILAAIEGLALLRDYPGKYGDVVDWLKPGDKATLKALYGSRSGVRPMMALAIDAANRKHNLSGERESSASRQPTPIASLIRRPA
jgi:hypothetical protein